ncbi:unnamed protein product [Urochloa humidicola]
MAGFLSRLRLTRFVLGCSPTTELRQGSTNKPPSPRFLQLCSRPTTANYSLSPFAQEYSCHEPSSVIASTAILQRCNAPPDKKGYNGLYPGSHFCSYVVSAALIQLVTPKLIAVGLSQWALRSK